jgi:site-specific recombinase XerD
MRDVRSNKPPTKLESVSRLITLFRIFNQAKGLSSVTIRWYDENLSHFAKEYGASLTSESILSFFAHLQNEHSCHAVTVNMYFRSLRAFFNFCVAQKLTSENPLMGLSGLHL